MITKQQALEFIYNILQHSRKVNLIMFSGILEVDYFEDTLGYDYKGYGEPYSLEDMVKQFIIENDSTQILQGLHEFPVDIDMLEVGQTYRVVYSNYFDELEEFTSKLINIDYDRYTNYKLFEFSNDSIVNQGHVEEVYKVNK